MERRQADVLGDEHKDGSLWINHDDEIWAWVQGDWRTPRTIFLTSRVIALWGNQFEDRGTE
ncbi:hypothetical protein I5G97_gp020 [Mycobacterium phage Curiosium]|uniref:Uncharacterized protein n=1 Tax=Mycobacterium phage Curiosium TaxID=2599859 RepID=A0A5J6TTH8_9CAUD|nr:hypothetical protein I5G97_gp020 [Mycobacterium phage Curiosium]QFG14133.1 hypothetical protein PBI_CURIOSIUM_90 [Mycobacterium phage Curiosium]